MDFAPTELKISEGGLDGYRDSAPTALRRQNKLTHVNPTFPLSHLRTRPPSSEPELDRIGSCAKAVEIPAI